MAEARAACHPVPAIGLHSFRVDPALHTTQVAVSSDGFVLYIPHPIFIWKSFKRWVHETRTQIQTLLWPLRPRFVIAVICGFALYVSGRPKEHWLRSGRAAEIIWTVDSKLPLTNYLPTPIRVAYLAVSTASALILTTVFVQKTFLWLLLSYHGWLFEPRGKPSLWTKFWATCLKRGYLNRGLVAGKPLLFAFQYALPALTPPSPEDTVKDWLATMKPVVSETEYLELTKEAKEFIDSGVAKQLQSYLWRKSLISRNYVTDWWVRFVYLRGRSSLFVNSNFYGITDGCTEHMPSRKQIPRASVFIYHWLLARQLIDRERLPPLCLNDFVPLCMEQYRCAFNCVRIPGRECDRLQTWDHDESKHLVVIYKGSYYKLVPFSKDTGRLLLPMEIQMLLNGIVEGHNHSDVPTNIAALTTMDRTSWADVRENYLMDYAHHNRATLDNVERAMFIVNLDDDSPQEYDDIARKLFVGDGTDRWCDKSFSFVVFKNGYAGIHCEHTWADAPVIAHLFEWCTAMEQRNRDLLYTADGELREGLEVRGTVKWSEIGYRLTEKQAAPVKLETTKKLSWTLSTGLEEAIQKAKTSAREAMADLDLRVTTHDAYGKGLVKKGKVSPDAWIQMALQLAYYRDQGRFDLTYESSMTRLFFEGRTETIRSASAESCAFVKAMDDPSCTNQQRLELLRKASDRHTNTSRMAMVGRGVDRHLFALYVVSVGKDIKAPFLQRALACPWKLSTSQVPQRQVPPDLWPGRDMGDKFYAPSGGFGPVADDGYGVSYCVNGDTRFFFHVSSKKACTSTDSSRMTDQIHRAMAEMGALVSP